MTEALPTETIEYEIVRFWKEIGREEAKGTICTGSMRPLMRPGDQVVFRFENDWRLGDIVVFTNGKEWFAHRLIEQYELNGEPILLVKGDGLRYYATPIPESAAVGCVIRIIRSDGRILNLETSLFRTLGRLIAFLQRIAGHLGIEPAYHEYESIETVRKDG